MPPPVKKLGEINQEEKIVVFEAITAGIGNQMYGAISAMLYAVITNRRFMMHFGEYADISSLFSARDGGLDWTYDDQKGMDTNRKILESLDDCSNGYDWEGMQNGDARVVDSENVITIHSNCFFINRMINNPVYKSRLEELGLQRGSEWGQLFNANLQLVPSLQARVDTFKTLLQSSFSISLQIRTNFMTASDGAYNWSMEKIWDHFAVQAEKLVMERIGNEPYREGKWHVFLSSDNEEIVQRAKNRFQEKLVTVEGEIETDGELNPNRMGVWEKVVLDWWLLGECDEMLMTGWSTFGSTAAMRAGVQPHVACPDKWDHRDWKQVSRIMEVESCTGCPTCDN